MTVICINCGHKLDLNSAYDDYQGRVKCWVCGCLLEISTVEGRLKRMAIPSPAPGRRPKGAKKKP